MPGVDGVFHRKSTGDGTIFAVEIPRSAHNAFWSYVAEVEKKTNGHFRLQIGPPARPITRGYRSQLSRHWGHAQDIAEQLTSGTRAYTKEMVDKALRTLAVREGLPTVYNEIDDTVEAIHSSAWTVEDANIVERVKQKWCDEHGLYLTEYRTLPDGTVEPYRSLAGRSYEDMAIYYRERGEV